jgi:hypothetical protein
MATYYVELPSLHVPRDGAYNVHRYVVTISSDATALLINLTKVRPWIQTELNVKTRDGGQQISGLVDCAATLDFVS